MIFRWNVTYLSIFKDILEAVQIINNNNTTHYDLKWDNIVLDFAPNEISIIIIIMNMIMRKK